MASFGGKGDGGAGDGVLSNGDGRAFCCGCGWSYSSGGETTVGECLLVEAMGAFLSVS